MIDADCYWNYRGAKCEFPEFCEYRYAFGDVILDQSCRLRKHRLRPATPTQQLPLVNPASVPSLPQQELPPLDFSRPFCSTPCHQTARAVVSGGDSRVCSSEVA